MSKENFGWVGIAICRLVCISDSNIEDRCLTAGPESINCKDSSEFRRGDCAIGPGYWHVPTWMDEWFVGDIGWCVGLAAKLAPSGDKIVVSVKD